MEMALTFNDITLSPVTHNDQIWIKSSELASALGYKDETSTTRIYQRNADEFTDEMTQVIEISSTVNLTVPTRVFSLRGCHLLAMFARTKVAKAFRKWVLDVLDRMAESEPEENPNTILPEKPVNALTNGHKTVLQTIINTRTHNLPKAIKYTAKGEMWGKLHRFFQLQNISYLPDVYFDRACKYLMEMELDCVAEQQALPAGNVPALVKPANRKKTRPVGVNGKLDYMLECLAEFYDFMKQYGGVSFFVDQHGHAEGQ